MFRGFWVRMQNIRTIRELCQQAEKHARTDGQEQPAAEHLLLASFDLPDGTAQQVFAQLAANPADIRPAIERQYADALKSVGIVTIDAPQMPPATASSLFYHAAPSGQAVLQALASDRRRHDPLLAAHVLYVIAGMKSGVTARALRLMGIDLGVLAMTANEIAAAHPSAS